MTTSLSQSWRALGPVLAAAMATLATPTPASAQRPRIIQKATREAPPAARRPEGTTISCNQPGGAQSSQCPVLQLGRHQIWAFSLRNNSYGFVLAAYDGDRLVGHRALSGARYLEEIKIDQRARTVAFIGQGGRPARISFEDLTTLTGSSQTTAPTSAGRRVNRPAGKQCAVEGGHCHFDGEGEVYYGAQDAWTVATHRGGAACSNATFGDPKPGIRKACFVRGATPRRPLDARARGRRCADEGGQCRFPGRGRVYYGAGDRWISREADGSIACTNATFGDPIVGTRKACFVEPLAGPRPIRRPRPISQPTSNLPRRLSLRSHHGKFVVAEADGNANANRNDPRDWERFTVEPLENGKVALKSHHGKYLVAERDGRVNANRPSIGEWEQWQVIRHPDGTVSLRSHHGKFLVAEKSGQLHANRDRIKEWERFRVIPR